MRVVTEIVRTDCKITIFQWNNRYIIKLEQGLLEQTFKINELDIMDEESLLKISDDVFVQEASARFMAMAKSLQDALQRS